MKMRKGCYILLVLLFLLSGCLADKGQEQGDAQSTNTDKVADERIADGRIVAEAVEGDFHYRLMTDKEEYAAGEEVQLYAELEYTGALDQVTIHHAASPFFFLITEESRGYSIPYFMNQPGLSTTLVKGEPFRELYKPIVSYSLEDDQEYVAFIKSLAENGFAAGNYQIKGHTDFTTKWGVAPFKLNAKLAFKVN
jgi:hypothetical protein